MLLPQKGTEDMMGNKAVFITTWRNFRLFLLLVTALFSLSAMNAWGAISDLERLEMLLEKGNFKKLVAKCKRLDEASLRAPEVASLCAQGESLLLDLREGPAGVEELEDFARRWPDTPAGGMAWEKAANITYLTAKRSPDREGALAYVIEHYTGTEAATFALQLVYQDAIDEGSSAALCRFRERFPSAPQFPLEPVP